MNTMILLAWLSLAGAAALFIALAIFLHFIVTELEAIGGSKKDTYGNPASFLSKIRLGVRAIEVQTGGVPTEVTRLNGGLSAVADGMIAIDSNLDGVIAAVVAQEAA